MRTKKIITIISIFIIGIIVLHEQQRSHSRYALAYRANQRAVARSGDTAYHTKGLRNQIFVYDIAGINEQIVDIILANKTPMDVYKKYGFEEIEFIDKNSRKIWYAKLYDGKYILYSHR